MFAQLIVYGAAVILIAGTLTAIRLGIEMPVLCGYLAIWFAGIDLLAMPFVAVFSRPTSGDGLGEGLILMLLVVPLAGLWTVGCLIHFINR